MPNATQDGIITGEICDLAQRLNNAAWAAAHMCGRTVRFHVTQHDDGRDVIQPVILPAHRRNETNDIHHTIYAEGQ